MDRNRVVQTSKFLALILRHQPDAVGVTLDAAGWTDVSTLLQKMNNAGHPITRADLDHVVAVNNKSRFAFDDSGTRIRASQGHSQPVELGYPPCAPPAVLYHGTSLPRINVIFRHGLHKKLRHHVHLYASREAARRVGKRHGEPRVLQIDAVQMHQDGHVFYVSANGVWLTDNVPPAYITVMSDSDPQ